jgi:hypothetical protein
MRDGVTDLFGIEIPSTSPVFLIVVGAHVLIGLAAVVFGAIAIFSKKQRGRHPRFGICYYWAIIGTTVTAALLTAVRFAENVDVMTLGLLCLGAVWFGRTALRRRWPHWARLHLTGMGLSYILLLTAFYVENGADLPLWNRLPTIAYWLIPGAVGIPIIVFALMFHPVARGLRQDGP